MESYKQKIALSNVRFFAHHGYYPEEQILGNEFLLNIECYVAYIGGKEDLLENTANYETLYQLAKQQMQQPKKLLETVVENILHAIKDKFPQLSEITVNIRKSNPPFGGDTATAEVSLTWEKH
ncbi:dihydroneopterin aldolase [Olivibacter domesticus]|uniref:7,8-dihydroneopterin aldolase n=1 Tax=Olivibacter domesticus TaxID=407022 RepID=A0A1H7V2I1_OLID1|nr:dihydroneopterin aldolase [Olivibacter domesticus]SEM03249.1 dihydroneopterin aldolase [Olivibacter domesticus]